MKFNNINVQISKKAILGKNVKIGDNTIIYDNVIIGDNTIIADNCIIGEPTNDYYYNLDYENKNTIIGSNSLIRSQSLIYAGSEFGENFSCGHKVTIRENIIFGKYCRVGTLCDFQGNTTIGEYCWFHSNVHIGQNSTIGNYVFVYPYVIFTNDPTPPSYICNGPTVGDYSQIGVMSVLLPAINIGKHVLIGASTVVSKNAEDFQLIMGNPGKFIKDVREIKDRTTNGFHYPWPEYFERGMPWEGKNYNEWLNDKIK